MTVQASIMSSDAGDVVVRLSGQVQDRWDDIGEKIRAGISSVRRQGSVIIDLSDAVVSHPVEVVTLARQLATDFGSGAVRLVCPRLPARRLLRRMLAEVPVGLLPSLETALAEPDPDHSAVHQLQAV